jgi:hypothetical protein
MPIIIIMGDSIAPSPASAPVPARWASDAAATETVLPSVPDPTGTDASAEVELGSAWNSPFGPVTVLLPSGKRVVVKPSGVVVALAPEGKWLVMLPSGVWVVRV